MGWTCLYDKPNNVKEYLDRMHTWHGETHDFTVLDSAIVSFRTYYAAVERVCRATGVSEVSAAIVMLTFHKTGEEFCYKELTENCGPHQVQCPMRILELLTDTDNKYAIEWREACLAYHDKRASGNGLKHGAIVTFKQPMKFTNGMEYSEMRVLKEGRKTRFTPVDDPYSRYRIDKSALIAFMA